MRALLAFCPQDNLMWDTWMTMWQLAAVTAADEIGFFECLKNKKLPIAKVGLLGGNTVILRIP